MEETKEAKKNKSTVLEWIRDIMIALIVGFLILQLVKPTIVLEHSMEPTLQPDNYIFLSRQSYRLHEPERGDIVVFKSDLLLENGKKKLLIKRIIGLPGDQISISQGKVNINGQAIEESYTMDGFTEGDMAAVTVPEKSVFVMGDNRQHSIDSRNPAVGFVEDSRIVGKAFLRLYPFNEIRFLSNEWKEKDQ
jgi:signal peptidase I